jgi:hypothetical protein
VALSNYCKGFTVTATGTSYVPGGTGFLTNRGYGEVQISSKRVSEVGSGALTITLEEYDPQSDDWYPLEDGAGNAITLLAYAADETDAAGERQLVRIGRGVVADADQVLAIAGSETNWYDYTVPLRFRLKLVEAGTSSVVNLNVCFLV